MLLGQLDTGRSRKWIALVCLFLVLIFTGLEAAHAHPAPDVARGSSPCAICIVVHANAVALTAHTLPVVFTVETVTVPVRAEHKSTTAEISLFIRPPPAA